MKIKGFGNNEFTLDTNGYSFHIIYAKQINGWFIAIPNWGICTEAASPANVGWNAEQLEDCKDETVATNATEIAEAIKEYMEG